MKAIEKYYHLIGIDEWVIQNGTVVLGTTLGSCVAICLWDPESHTGGLNHFLLPSKPSKNDHSIQGSHLTKKKYKEHEVIEILIDQMMHLGYEPKKLRALVVGGATSHFDYYQVGNKNIQIALKLLEDKGIRQVKVSTGGPYSRRIQFHLDEGKVLIRKIDLNKHHQEVEEIIFL